VACVCKEFFGHEIRSSMLFFADLLRLKPISRDFYPINRQILTKIYKGSEEIRKKVAHDLRQVKNCDGLLNLQEKMFKNCQGFSSGILTKSRQYIILFEY
jgi:hypothetical protein